MTYSMLMVRGMATILVPKEKKRFRAFEDNMTWFQDNYEGLKQKYAGEYIAVNNGEVIDHDKNPVLLIKRLREKYSDLAIFAIEHVSDNNIELIL